MGYSSARDMAEQADERSAVIWHLRSNLFPPAPMVMVEPALQAIHNPTGDIVLPDGVTFRDGRTKLPARQVIESLHLQAFVDALDDDDSDEDEE